MPYEPKPKDHKDGRVEREYDEPDDARPEEVRIETSWNVYNTALFVKKLQRHVRKEDFPVFEFAAKIGSIGAEVIIESTTPAVMSYLMTRGIEELVRYLSKRIRKQGKKAETAITIQTEEREVRMEIPGENVDEIITKLTEKGIIE